MGKGIVGEKNSDNTLAKTTKIRKAKPNTISLERSKEKYAQFFEFLKRLHGSERKEKPFEEMDEPLVREVTLSVMQFFNEQKKYQLQQLQRYVIYLANLLNILRDQSGSLNFEGEFKRKIKRFLNCMVQAKAEGKSKNSKIQALLYILAILIYKERVNVDRSIQNINNSIYSDRSLVKLLLSLTLSKYKKMSKFYGVIMIHLSNQQNSSKIKQTIIKSIFTNISKIDHEPTFFNFLLYLRSEKNKVKINYHDIIDGQIFEILLDAYPKYINRHQSYYILDYMNHLLTLFPTLATKIPQQKFITKVLLMASPDNIHHPLQESTIISFVKNILKYAESNARNIILHEIIIVLLTHRHLTLKLAHLVMDYDIEQSKMMQLLESGVFKRLLNLINPNVEQNLMKRIIDLYNKVIIKFGEINKPISEYMKYQLNSHLKLIQGARVTLADNHENNNNQGI